MGLWPPRAGYVTLDGVSLPPSSGSNWLAAASSCAERGSCSEPERGSNLGSGIRTGARPKSLERTYGLFRSGRAATQKAATLFGRRATDAGGRRAFEPSPAVMLDNRRSAWAPLIVQEILRVIGQLNPKADDHSGRAECAARAVGGGPRLRARGRPACIQVRAPNFADPLKPSLSRGCSGLRRARDQVYVD